MKEEYNVSISFGEEINFEIIETDNYNREISTNLIKVSLISQQPLYGPWEKKPICQQSQAFV